MSTKELDEHHFEFIYDNHKESKFISTDIEASPTVPEIVSSSKILAHFMNGHPSCLAHYPGPMHQFFGSTLVLMPQRRAMSTNS